MARTDPHVVETRNVNWFRTKVADFYENGDALYRGLSERDYGVDGIIELFENRMPTGKIALVQIKATSKTITPMKRTPEFVSCTISSSNAKYATQKNIPVILAYISLTPINQHPSIKSMPVTISIVEADKVHVLGTPEELQVFISS